MSHPQTQQALRTITVLAPLTATQASDTTRRLRLLDRGPSPFAASDRTHFARLVVLPDHLPAQPRPTGMRWQASLIDLVAHLGRRQHPDRLGRPYLLFSATYDDPDGTVYGNDHRPYLEHLRQRLGVLTDDIWSSCEHYPGRGDPELFGAFLTERILPARYVFAPARAATVSQIRSALHRRSQVIDIAVSTQTAAATTLRRRLDDVIDVGPRSPAGPPQDPATPADDSLGEAQEWNAGARRQALADPAPRQMTAPTHGPDLTDVQGLTVGYPGHDAAVFVFLRITDPERARRWLAAIPVTTAAQANHLLAAAAGRTRDAATTGQVARHVGFSYAGLTRLGLPRTALTGFDRSFRTGMARREHALAPGRGTRPWQRPYRAADAPVHLLVHLSAPDADRLTPALRQLRDDLTASGGVVEVACEHGRRIPDPTTPPHTLPRYLEHFGFTDGISQPIIEGLGRSNTADLPTGELLLGHQDIDGDTSGATAPAAYAFNGCYLVFRKLEQDVQAFHHLTRGIDAAKLVGRRRDGVALTASMAPDAHLRFQADDPEGIHCPIGAHIRRVNPRDSRPLTVDAPGCPAAHDTDPIEPRLARRHRMLRRGLPYGQPYEQPTTTRNTATACERGLLFVALVADIARQFEFVQTQWMNDGQAFRLGSDPDIFSGAAGPGLKITVQGHPPSFVPVPRPVVTCRGGEYFLLPGVTALRNLTGEPERAQRR